MNWVNGIDEMIDSPGDIRQEDDETDGLPPG